MAKFVKLIFGYLMVFRGKSGGHIQSHLDFALKLGWAAGKVLASQGSRTD